MKLRNVERWTEGKAPFPAYMSAFLVTHADMMFGALKGQAYHKGYAMLFEVKDIAAWSGFYREFITEKTVGKAFESLSENATVQAYPLLMEELHSIKTPQDLNRSAITDWLRTHFLDDFELIEDESDYEERLRKLKPFLEIPFFAFGFRVYFPCILYYHSAPQTLAARAVRGDIEAFRCLLNLDKNLLSVPAMHSVWEPISRNPQSAHFKSLMRAMANSPHEGLKPARVKTVFAAAIEGIFTLTGENITRSEIRDLYDRYAQDTKGALIDEDLPGTEDGFDVAVRREKKAWIAAMGQTP